MKARIFIILLISYLLTACEKYEDYITDFDYTSTYFAYQNPVRTVFSDNLNIEIGAVLAGKRDNKKDETVTFKIAEELLADASIVGKNKFTLLPSDYYTLSNNSEMVISKGEFVGKVTLSLNADKFLSDPLATKNSYALPLLITSTSLDSIIVGDAEQGIPRKDYTIVVVKYIDKDHGIYYHRGQRKKYDSTGKLVDVLRYVTEDQEDEYIQNVVWNMFTVNAGTLRSNGVGEHTTASGKNYGLDVSVSNDNKVSIKGYESSLIPNIVDLGSSVYNKEDKSFYLNYQYEKDGFKYIMSDTLYFRNDGLKLELW